MNLPRFCYLVSIIAARSSRALENGRSSCAICDKRQYLLRIALCELAVRIEVVDNTLLVTRHAGAK